MFEHPGRWSLAVFAALSLLVIVVMISLPVLQTNQEMVRTVHCSKIVGEKYYQTILFGMRTATFKRVYVLADGQEVLTTTIDYRTNNWDKDGLGNACKTEFVPKKEQAAK